MRADTRLACTILATAAVLGILGDAMLRSTPWGLNFYLWTVALSAGLVLVAWARWSAIPKFMLLPSLFALFIAWRDAPFLRFWDTLAVLAALAIATLQVHGVRLKLASLFDFMAGAMVTGTNIAVGPLILLLKDIRWNEVSSHTTAKRATAVALGVSLSIPLVLVFGSLLTSADPVFDALVRSAIDWKFETIASHLTVTCLVAWVTLGYLWGLAFGDRPKLEISPNGNHPRLGILEVGIPLLALVLVFLAFTIVQARYLFGGEQTIQVVTGLTYSEYARRGFFELVVATSLVVPVLLAADWILDRRDRRSQQCYRVIATVILVLVFLMMISAGQRMRLYVDAYGLTVDRLYASAFMVWIGSVLLWFSATALFRDGRHFGFGMVTSGFALLAALNVLNPDALIARTNLARLDLGESRDIPYLASLSADAVPALLTGLRELDLQERCIVWEEIERRRWVSGKNDWRSWNLGRVKAMKALAHPAVTSSRLGCRP
ncbi:MAG: hypothetical protein AMS18_03775 [Gemmatimonas sp. SG8_17]|nr:MAG: hypothetical protein AMS18_03775 [Gemmatimonas sp. SG8_17]